LVTECVVSGCLCAYRERESFIRNFVNESGYSSIAK